jgi:hypothetical protein
MPGRSDVGSSYSRMIVKEVERRFWNIREILYVFAIRENGTSIKTR